MYQLLLSRNIDLLGIQRGEHLYIDNEKKNLNNSTAVVVCHTKLVSVPKSFPAMVFLAVEQLAAVVLVCCCRFQHFFINTNAFILSLDVRVSNHKCLVCIH